MPHPQPNKPARASVRADERGFASMVIALVMIIVLGLLTVAFAQLARREQQSALDKQLASQAYYAAESGVNDIVAAIHKPDTDADSINKDTPGVGSNKCLNPLQVPALAPDLSPTYGVHYTCAIVNIKLPELHYDGVPPTSGQSVSFSTDGGGTLDHFTVKWSSAAGHTAFRTGGGFPNSTSWGNAPGVLQLSLTPISNPANVSRADLTSKTFSVFLYPSSSGSGTVSYMSAQGQVVGGNCHTSANDYDCQVTITGLPTLPATGQVYAVDIVDYYDASNISLADAQTSLGTALTYVDGQAQIDVTGQARNVLKRIQVRVPIKNPPLTSEFGLDGQNICKRLQTQPAGVDPEKTNFIDMGGAFAAANDPCNLISP